MPAMATTSTSQQRDEPHVQLATRVPAGLVHRVKVWCVEHDVSVMAFVADALRDKLRRAGIRGV